MRYISNVFLYLEENNDFDFQISGRNNRFSRSVRRHLRFCFGSAGRNRGQLSRFSSLWSQFFHYAFR